MPDGATSGPPVLTSFGVRVRGESVAALLSRKGGTQHIFGAVSVNYRSRVQISKMQH